jgi:hypothetical protein
LIDPRLEHPLQPQPNIPFWSENFALVVRDDELIARLTSLHGIGRWTVEMLLMHTLGRPDVLPVDDVGAREGWRLIKGMAKQPTSKELATAGAPWAPYRSTASWYLWRAVDQYKLAMTKGNLHGTAQRWHLHVNKFCLYSDAQTKSWPGI